MAGIAVTKKAKARKAEWERICNLSHDELTEDYLARAKVAWEMTWDVLHVETGWQRHKVKVTDGDLQTAVYSQKIPDVGKVFKVEREFDVSAEELFTMMVRNAQDSPTWNPTIIQSEVILHVDTNTDVAYYVTAEAAKGVIDSRDFVNVRHWQERSGTLLSVGLSVMHPSLPPTRKFTRGENLAGGGMAFKHLPGERCRFVWLVNTDLKGMLPSKIVEEAIPDVCVETIGYIRKQLEDPTNGHARQANGK